MKRELSVYQFAGFVFTTVFGSLFHFVYDWTNQSILVAPFSAVNESTWEHMKLLFFPSFVFALIQSRYFSEYKNFWCVKLAGIVIGLLIIPALFYTYNGAIGKSPDWINIVIFFIAAAIEFFIEYLLFKNEIFGCKYPKIAFLLICLIGVPFVVFTFATPAIPLFRDPVTGIYGIVS
ncbi:MAG: hypothetical protein E7384_02075 [Ruminococcaceae bacterium]|nr:hypothetical protein [Oscillospiraceae bacterium]